MRLESCVKAAARTIGDKAMEEAAEDELKRVFAASRHVKNWVNSEVKSGNTSNTSKIGLRNYFKEVHRGSPHPGSARQGPLRLLAPGLR